MKLSRRPLPLLLGAAGIASAAAIAIGGAQLASNASAAGSAAGTSISSVTNPYADGYGTRGGRTWGAVPGSGDTGASGTAPATTDGTTTTGTTTEATASQLVGVVDIVTTVGYDQGEAAGTGMVLTSAGEVLTNNHVVDGATSIEVTVLSTGRSYSAKVVGTSPTNDVAVLQLSGATGLATVDVGESTSLQVGDAITGVGNAGNEDGTSAATGQVTALNQDITASDGTGTDSEDLTGLIMTNAAIEAGDSGGPLHDAQGQVVGIDTAAQTSGRSGQTVAGYAIPIDTALAVADQITSGVDNATIHQGVPAFLGIQTASASANGFGQQDSGLGASSSGSTGAAVDGVVSGSAAQKAGITAGSTITGVGGKAIGSSADLTAALATHDAGDRVSVTWTDASGTAHTATVTLGSGPAD
ncbi:S1C family serine protease [Pedococcus bigeumensis]|nr:trypsin-like peptidase domain-containing protein [Pedococcus bigeumensis]